MVVNREKNSSGFLVSERTKKRLFRHMNPIHALRVSYKLKVKMLYTGVVFRLLVLYISILLLLK
jgi:hypothetical protein